MKLADLSITKKLWISTLAMLVAMFAAAAWTQRNANLALSHAMERVQSFENVITLATEWKGMTEASMQRTIAIALSIDPLVGQAFGPKMKDGLARITKQRELLMSLAQSPEDRAALERTVKAGGAVLATLKQVDELKLAGDMPATKAHLDGPVTQAVDAYLGSIDAFIKAQESQREAAKAEAAQTRSRSLVIGLAVMAVVVAFSIGTMVLLSRSIRVPLARAIDVSKAIAEGDLTQRIDTSRGDEFGQLMRAMSAMSERLRGLVSQVRTGVDSVATASSEIATGNQDLSARTEQTASNLQQTASSMEQLTGTVSQSADVARQANQLAASAVEAATRGGTVVSEVVTSMNKISDSSKKIADIIGVIDGIAFQTNILALNAAVEAARAGEQGRGFAVVAGEVRSLAQRSAEAAREIKSLIHASVGDVEVGSSLVEQTGQAMSDIVAGVRRVSDLIGEIASAADEQRDGISQVNQAVTNLDQMTQQNAALVEESAAAAQSLREQAGRLTSAVAVFKVGDTSPAVVSSPVALAPAAPVKPASAPVAAAAVKRPAVTPAPKKVPNPTFAAPPAVVTPKAAPVASSAADDGDWTSF